MKQILQNLGTGETLLAEVPCPQRRSGSVLIHTRRTLVSLGTEKMLVDFGKGGYLAKARSQPDKVKQVLQKIKTDGLWTTVDAVRAKLDTPIPLGYCNVGTVLESDAASKYGVGQRVVSNGPHAEVVSIGENLIAAVPDDVSDETAAYTVLCAIGLQGIRLAQPTLGERFVVCGLGLIGLLTVQMLRAHGCEVMGTDFDPQKLELAKQFGAVVCDLGAGEDPIRAADVWTGGCGVDGVLITASTKSDEVVHQAATMCRKRGRIVLVGVVGLKLRRADFYEKELSFQVSCSYGPGRYDPLYEQKGLDYPIGHVRWTEQRNFEAVLGLMSQGKIQTEPLSTHRFAFDDALEGYQAIDEPGALGILLEYPQGEAPLEQTIAVRKLGGSGQSRPRGVEVGANALERGAPGLGFIGAGGFTTRMLLPLLPEANVDRRWIVSHSGTSAAHAARKFGFSKCGSNVDELLSDQAVDAVFVTTSHASHADLVCRCLDAGKSVFVEKPLAMDRDGAEQIRRRFPLAAGQKLMIGFNRRFSPHTVAVQRMLDATPGAKTVLITVNAGAIPESHWTQDASVGGGRIIGEACHFIDLARFLVGETCVGIDTAAVSQGEGRLGDCASMQMRFAEGSIASVHYLSSGNKAFPKERIEVFAGGRVCVIDNFRKSYAYGNRKSFKTRRQDKGHGRELLEFIRSLGATDYWPIRPDEMFEVTELTFEAHDAVQRQLKSFGHAAF